VVDLPLTTWLTAGLVFISVTLGAMSLAFIFEYFGARRRQRQVVEQLQAFDRQLSESSGEAAGLLRRTLGESALMQSIMARTPSLVDLKLLLMQAGMETTVDAFLLTMAGSGIGAGLALLVLTGSPIFATIAAIVGTLIPWFWVKRRRARRFAAFESGLPEAIDLLGRAIRAGHPLSSGLKMVADETQEPIAGEFLQTFEEQRFGMPFDEAIMALADRVTIIDMRILVTAILIQREVGGNLAEVLDNLASVIRARFTIRRQLRVYTAQGRISGYVLALLPIVVGGAIYGLNPEYGSLMFTEPMGRSMLMLAAFMQIMGFLWIRKIIDIDI
jgi:tight adherence protein B